MVLDVNLILGIVSALTVSIITIMRGGSKNKIFLLSLLVALGFLTYYAYIMGAYAFMIWTIVWFAEIFYFGFIKMGEKKK